ncbi:MAG: M20/M25/M40 family metallo-hydrolase [Crocinitomicaceae bacterium]|nr:M20/M25/M40 family metallo-hydrolase [Crocinitomicaceae bacterium]
MKFLLIIFSFILFQVAPVIAQLEDSIQLRCIYNEVLERGECYENLRVLCKEVGNRLSGSENAEKAVVWGEALMKRYGFDRVYLQEIMVPKWVRGSIEKLMYKDSMKNFEPAILALGGSVGTNGILQGQVIEVRNFKELEELGKKEIQGKIVFFNRPMNPTLISTFHAYGGCVDQRHAGASEAAKYGAIATITRSMTLRNDRIPHTGSMSYKEGIKKIPAVAISTVGAYNLSEVLKRNPNLSISLELSCKSEIEVKSYNVIAEIKGKVYPEKVMVVGGHLDSWDVGEGAHDDGAGVVQSVEVLRLFKKLSIQPRHTLRCILFMNEENGNRGGKSYARLVKEKGEEHILALESDRGGFSPRGFSVDGTTKQLETIQRFEALFRPYNLHLFNKGYGGVDIGPLKDGKICLIGLVPDSQRYFDFHHASSDIWENVNERELELGAAATASLIYLIDKYGFEQGLKRATFKK